MVDPVPAEFARACAALYPFVAAYGLPLNPADVEEMAYAVLQHAFTEASSEEIDEAVTVQIQEYLSSSVYGHDPQTVVGQATARWAVMRQDDNGNIYQVARHHERADADVQIGQLSAGHHKQLYWVTDLQSEPK